jgi:hypothetical protein
VFGDFYDTLDDRERYIVVQTVDQTALGALVGVAYMAEAMSGMQELIRIDPSRSPGAGILLSLLGGDRPGPSDRAADEQADPHHARAVEGGNLDNRNSGTGLFRNFQPGQRVCRLMLAASSC